MPRTLSNLFTSWQEDHMTTFSKTTNNVEVQVKSAYYPERSNPKNNVYVFSYQVTIRNLSDQIVQLISRHWIITDALGRVEEIAGPGVVGEQPIIQPFQEFSYVSFCPLSTSFGTMHGFYHMKGEQCGEFTVEIPEFVLAHPYAIQ